jgi:RHS repeat-associated protein
MPGRSFNSNSYKYGFNGKENDNEVVGTGEGTQDFGARIYNPALGKFLSCDPKGAMNPGLSPYSFAANNPIMFIDVKGENPGLPFLFAVGAIANFVTQVSVHYALNGGDLGAALKKVDYFDVIMTGFETMIGGTAGLSNGLENTFAKLATVEFAKATMDLTFEAPPRQDNGTTKDGNKVSSPNSVFSNFNIKIAGKSKDGKEVLIEIASSKIFGIVGKYLSGQGDEFVKGADLDMKEAIRLNNTSPVDLAPSIKVNGVVQSVDFTAAYESGSKVISEIANEKFKSTAVDATKGTEGGTPTLPKPDRPLNSTDKTKVNLRR